MESSLISVIIPVFNTGKHLYKCLDSIINQTYKRIELILVDDGSTDGSSEVCDEYAKKDSRITVIHQENSGVSKARNAGIRIATGDYYYFPDSDDYIDLDCFEYCLNLMNEYKCDIVTFEHFVTYKDKEIKHSNEAELYGLFDTEGAHKNVLIGTAFAWNRFFSKRAVKYVQFNEDILRGEDVLFVHECIENIDKAYFDKRAMYHYVQSEESAVRGKFRAVQLTGMKLYDIYKDFYEKKYPGLLRIYLKGCLNLPVQLYFDMFIDDEDYSKEMNNVYSEYKKRYKEVKNSVKLSKKNYLKYTLFYVSPKLFCFIHKHIH